MCADTILMLSRYFKCVVVLSLSYNENVSEGVMFFFFQAEDGIRDLVRSRGLGDVYKRQVVKSFGISCKTFV